MNADVSTIRRALLLAGALSPEHERLWMHALAALRRLTPPETVRESVRAAPVEEYATDVLGVTVPGFEP